MKYGPIQQMALVVHDADATMRVFTDTLGIGPFYVIRQFNVAEYQYRGKPAPAPLLTLCFAQSGGVQIEIIQQHNDAPSAYRDFLDAGHEGVQHVCVWPESPEAYDAKRAELLAAGFDLVHEGAAAPPAPRSRFAYFASGLPGALMVEISEAMIGGVRAFVEAVAAAAEEWDGNDPIREAG